MSASVNIVLLCEDKQLSAFSRRFLEKRGLTRSLTEVTRPHKTQGGSRKQWVDEEYPKQLKAIRQRNGAALIVCTDADEQTVEQRIAALNTACEKIGIKPCTDDDPVVMVVPKWNIETWLSYLRNESFNQDTKNNSPGSRYTGHEKDCKEQVQKLVDMCYTNQALKEPAPPSLKAACKEYKKLKLSR